MVSKKILGTGVAVLIIISIIVSFAFVNGAFNYLGETRTIEDQSGREVEIPTKVENIIAIQPGCLRLIVYMDAEDLVCGVEEVEKTPNARPYIFACPELSELPSIGPMFGGDPELIVEQDPDIIFSTYTTAEEANTLQELTGIPVVVLNHGDLNEGKQNFYNALTLLGDILQKQSRAADLINYIEGLIKDLNDRTKNVTDSEKKWLYVGGIGYRGAHGLESTECQYSPLRFINGKNSAQNLTTSHAFIDMEQLFKWENEGKLDYIIVDGGGYSMCINDLKNTTGRYGPANLECVNNDPPRLIMVLPYNWYSHNYATIFIDAYYLGKRFFPEEFSEIKITGINNIFDDIYENFLGKGVYEDMSNFYYGGFHNITHTEIETFVN